MKRVKGGGRGGARGERGVGEEEGGGAVSGEERWRG